MSYFFDLIVAWLRSHQNILGWAGLLSLIMMVATLLAVPLLINTWNLGFDNDISFALAYIHRGIPAFSTESNFS